jgi:peptide/nickel transport system ATP-binding protein
MSTVDLAPAEPVLDVDGLRIEVEGRGVDIVDGVSFALAPGEVLGLVGESGSGKTTVGLALLGHTRRGAAITAGSVRVQGRDVLKLPVRELRSLRGRIVSYVPQDPSTALNPALRIGRQLLEQLEAHHFGSSGDERRERMREMLAEVLLPSQDSFLKRYPHQLSGGQQQRVGLAMAFACRPPVIVLDEPTTGLDVTTQAHVLTTVRELCHAHKVAALYVSHDLAVVAALATRVSVMYAGRMVELGPRDAIFREAAHPYTRRLLHAIPDIAGVHALIGIPGVAPRPGSRPKGCFFAPRCDFAVERCHEAFPEMEQVSVGHETRCFRAAEVRATSIRERLPAPPALRVPEDEEVLTVRNLNAFYGERQVLFGANITVRPHECLALVGESGSGKTTLARCIAGLHRENTGDILLRGAPLPRAARARDRETRRQVQYIFQSPYSSLNPRKTIGQIVAQPLRVFFDLKGRERDRRVVETLEKVSISSTVVDRYPDQLSGGERQRVAIARALAAEPDVLVCDEITSALDVSVQAAIVELLVTLQREFRLGMLFVTHNLALIRTIAQQVAVMTEGRIVEVGPAADLFANPTAEYTKVLLSDTPSLELDQAPATPTTG